MSFNKNQWRFCATDSGKLFLTDNATIIGDVKMGAQWRFI